MNDVYHVNSTLVILERIIEKKGISYIIQKYESLKEKQSIIQLISPHPVSQIHVGRCLVLYVWNIHENVSFNIKFRHQNKLFQEY